MTKPAATRSRVVRLMKVIAILSVCSVAFASAAFADLYQRGEYQEDGNCCSGAEMDGWRIVIEPHTIHPGDNACLIASVLIFDQNGSKPYRHQLEAGDVRCGTNASIDGSCSTDNDKIKFVEYLDGGDDYSCYEHGNYQIDGADTFKVIHVDRPTGARVQDIYFRASINGNDYTKYIITDSTLGHPYKAYAWGEESGGGCGSDDNFDADFSDIERWNYANQAYAPVNSPTDTGNLGDGACFALSTYTNQAFTATAN